MSFSNRSTPPDSLSAPQRFVELLAHHALVEIRCDHDAKTDTPVCNCALIALGAHPSVQAAKEAWALHVWIELDKAQIKVEQA